jgi:hypothetical protein
VYALRTEVHKLTQSVGKLSTNFEDTFKAQQTTVQAELHKFQDSMKGKSLFSHECML